MMRLTQDWTLPGSGLNQFRTGSALSIGAPNQNQNLHDRGRTEPEPNPNPEFSSPGSGSNLGSELNFGNPTPPLTLLIYSVLSLQPIPDHSRSSRSLPHPALV